MATYKPNQNKIESIKTISDTKGLDKYLPFIDIKIT